MKGCNNGLEQAHYSRTPYLITWFSKLNLMLYWNNYNRR